MSNQEKYLKYKYKYLDSKQNGGAQESYHIYFCFNKEVTSVCLKSLKDFKTYDMNDIDCKLNLFAYKNSFNNEIDLVITSNSEKKISESFKLPKKLFIKEPFDKMKSTSKINLSKITKGLENKINSETKSDDTKTKPDDVKTKPDDVKTQISISDILLYVNNNNHMELISRYEIENDEIKETDVGDNFSIIFVDDKSEIKGKRRNSGWGWGK